MRGLSFFSDVKYRSSYLPGPLSLGLITVFRLDPLDPSLDMTNT
jgi:hypothetical protein